MIRLLCTGGLAVLLVATTGCGWFSDDEGVFVDRRDDYLQARERDQLVVPEDMDASRLVDPQPIPSVPAQENPTYFPDRPPLPDAIYSSDNREEVRIQRLGERQWLVVPESPTTVWPKIKQFLSENGVGIANDVPGDGRLDTQWLSVEDAGYRDVIRTLLKETHLAGGTLGGQDRLRIKVEQGLRALTSEIHVRHENDALGTPNAEGLVEFTPVRSALVKAESDMLNELGAYIAAKVSEQSVSRVALEIAGRQKSQLDRHANGDPVLRLFLDEERAWATVGQSLQSAQVEVVTSDRAQGMFAVRVAENLFSGEEEPGFFRRLITFGNANKVFDLNINISQVQAEQFEVVVRDTAGQLVDWELSQQVLVLLKEYAG